MKLNYRSWLCALLLFALVATQLPRTLAQTNEANPYAALKKGQVVHGFRTDAVYLDATDKPFGGHFIHVRTGFTLDLLQIRSVPQAVIYANTFTVSDMGEPYSATLTEYSDTSRDAILNFLASKLYTGGGAHSVFNKTVGAGLAYSNGIGSNPQTGLMSYYAERTPELPQTLRFAIGEVKRPMSDPLAEYVIALTFNSRASSPYEVRGEAMASNMADGVTPEVVSRFRRAILETRKIPDLSDQLYQRKDKVHERVFPGYGMKGKDIAGRNFFVIGAEKQMAAYEAYLKSVEGADTQLYRLYPRDFWLTPK